MADRQQSQHAVDQRSGPECCLSVRYRRISELCHMIGCGLADAEIEELEVTYEYPDQNEDAKTSLFHQPQIERHDHQRDQHRRRCAHQIDESVTLDAHWLILK